MQNILNNSQIKTIKFPKQEYIDHYGSLPELFTCNFAIENALGAFFALLSGSLVTDKIDIIPNRYQPECSFMYDLCEFEQDLLSICTPKTIRDIFKNKKLELSYKISQSAGKILIKTDVNIFENPKDLKIKVFIKLLPNGEYNPLLPNLKSTKDVENFITVNTKDFFLSIWDELCQELKPNSKIARSTIESIPSFLIYKGVELIQELNELVIEQDFKINNELSDNHLKKLSGLTLDVISTINHLWFARKNNNEDSILISVDDILYFRGKKPSKNAQGRRGGFKKQHREEIIKQIQILSNLEIKGQKLFDISKWKNDQTHLNADYFFIIKPSMSFRNKLLNGTPGVLNRKTLYYDPYRHKWEKRLSNYLHWQWLHAGQESFLDPYNIKLLVKTVKPDYLSSSLSQLRNRLENALDKLQYDNVIAAWEYKNVTNLFFEKPNFEKWLNSQIIIEPPSEVILKYSQNKVIKCTSKKEELDVMQIKKLLKILCLTQMQLAENLNLCPSVLSRVLNGKLYPSEKVYNKLYGWYLANNND